MAFQIAPRINAAGRMASASDIIELFSTTDPERARAIAAQLDELNKDRRETEDGIRQAILEQCLAQPVTDSDAALVFAGEGWHRGVVGIVASRVVERYHRPVFVLGLDDGVAYGSGRSIRAFHLLDALEAMPELFTKFGGHRQAAGVTLQASQVDEFRMQFQAYAATRLTVADFEAEIEIDAEIGFDEITDQTIAELLNLAPFGFGNPPPTLLARGVEVAAPPDIKNDKHVFLRLKSQGRTLRAKAWNFAERAAEFAPGTRIDVALQFEDDAYSAKRGYAPWQTIVRDVQPGRLRIAIPRRGDVGVHLAFQNLQGNRAGVEHYVVILAQRKLVAQRLAGFLAQLDNLQLPDHVRARLAGEHHVALHFAGFDAVVDGLLAGPVLGVQSGIDHQTACAPQCIVELSELAFRVAIVPAGFCSQALGVQPPAFDQRGDFSERAESGGSGAGPCSPPPTRSGNDGRERPRDTSGCAEQTSSSSRDAAGFESRPAASRPAPDCCNWPRRWPRESAGTAAPPRGSSASYRTAQPRVFRRRARWNRPPP